MKFTWLGHSGFRIEIGGQVLLLDPWFTGNPMFEGHDRDAAIDGATQILITHGHFDHAADAVTLSKELQIPILGVFDMVSHWEKTEGITGSGFHKGGTVQLGAVAVTMVGASHSSSLSADTAPIYAGAPVGFMIEHAGRVTYVSGDTDVMADMALFEELHHPEIGILCVGGHFTMDQKRAAYAARKFFNFKTVIPCHYRTFPMLAQDLEVLKAELPDIDIREADVMAPFEL